MTTAPLATIGPTVPDAQTAPGVRGRSAECEALGRMTQAVLAGRSQALVLKGEAGIGKTALLAHLMKRVPGCRVVQASATESEMELAFAGLHQLCTPFLDNLSRLPAPQRAALRIVFGLDAGQQPGQFLIGVSVLNLLAKAAEDQPLICLVDDAQWLDPVSAQTLAFVARRLVAEPVMMILAVREPTQRREWAGLNELTLQGLNDTDSGALLDSVVRGPMDNRVRHRIVSEARGNPLALLELPLAWTTAELADGLGRPNLIPPTSPTEESFARRVDLLPADTQQLLLIAAAEPLGDTSLLWRVAAELGIDPTTSLDAERAGLIECKGELRFLHPLVRAAAYRSASLSRRQRVHRALADATDPTTEPDRRAWHRALATAGPSEEIAEELERSAARAQARGGLLAAAAFLERAHTITPQPEPRARRGLAAASLTREAGSLEASLALLDALETGPPNPRTSAEVECLRGQIALDHGRSDEAARRLRSAAQQLEPFDSARAREIHLESLAAAMLASGFHGPEQLHEAADVATAAPAAPEPPRVSDLLLNGLTEHLVKGYATAVPSLTQALTLMAASESETDQYGRCWLTRHRVGSTIALELWDYESASALALRQVQVTRGAGAFVQLQFGLNLLATLELLAGRLSAAATLTAEDRMIAAFTGNLAVGYGDVLLAAFRGREEHATGLLRTVETNAAQGQDNVVNLVDYASAVLQNGLGRHDVAEQCAWRLFERGIVGHGTLVVSELAEAASRTGELAHLHAALEWLTERARATPTDWALGAEARTRALLSVGDDCDRLFRESIERLSRTRLRAELARTHLLYGEWLRREGRRVDARAQLRTSHHMLADMGMEGFAERARRQLLATGETAQKRTVGGHNALTPQEGQVASLAGDGHTNPQIAVQLFISPRTVEWHLRKIFAKLDITSRRQLRGALPPVDSEIVPA